MKTDIEIGLKKYWTEAELGSLKVELELAVENGTTQYDLPSVLREAAEQIEKGEKYEEVEE